MASSRTLPNCARRSWWAGVSTRDCSQERSILAAVSRPPNSSWRVRASWDFSFSARPCRWLDSAESSRVRASTRLSISQGAAAAACRCCCCCACCCCSGGLVMCSEPFAAGLADAQGRPADRSWCSLIRNQDEQHAYDHGRQGDEIFYSHIPDFRVRVRKAPAAAVSPAVARRRKAVSEQSYRLRSGTQNKRAPPGEGGALKFETSCAVGLLRRAGVRGALGGLVLLAVMFRGLVGLGRGRR